MNVLCFLIFVYIVGVTGLGGLHSSNVVIYNKNITVSDYYYRERLTFVRSNKVNINYRIKFDKKKCCPIIGVNFVTKYTDQENANMSVNFCYTKNFDFSAIDNKLLISTKEGMPDNGCSRYSMDHVCKGSRHFLAPYPQY